MSYILDALKKAEAERRQEKVPGIHSQPLAAPAVPHRESPWRHPAVRIAAAVAVAAALAATVWLKPWQSPSASTSVSPPLPPSPSPSVPPPITQAPTPAAAVAPPAAATPQVLAPSVTPAPPAIRPPSADARATAAIDAATSKPMPHHEPKSKPHSPEKATAAASSASEEPRVPSLRELPESIQRDIPELKVGGYIYADKPADRSVIINNRLLREGDEAAPGVTLERMQQHGMILRYKEYRFRSSY